MNILSAGTLFTHAVIIYSIESAANKDTFTMLITVYDNQINHLIPADTRSWANVVGGGLTVKQHWVNVIYWFNIGPVL